MTRVEDSRVTVVVVTIDEDSTDNSDKAKTLEPAETKSLKGFREMEGDTDVEPDLEVVAVWEADTTWEASVECVVDTALEPTPIDETPELEIDTLLQETKMPEEG